MKKNKMMRIASVLLVAVLLSTCAISGTFAKYTTTVTDSDTARVAKWGMDKLTMADLYMFDGQYKDGENVNVDATTNVIAPGAFKTVTVDITKPTTAPEVAYSFALAINATGNADLLAKLQWKLNKGSFGTFAELQTAVAALGQARVEAGALPTADDFTITWQWPFYVDGAGDTSDTNFGNAASLEEISVTLSITATQIGE